jgi:hypothetical protein
MACRITNIKDENLKLLIQQYGQADGLKRFLKGELDAEASLLKFTDNQELYKQYNLINKDNRLKEVNPNDEKIKAWVKTLNNSPYYLFKVKKTSDGKSRVFIYDKLASMEYNIQSASVTPKSKSSVALAKLKNFKTNLYNLKNKSITKTKTLELQRRISTIESQIEKLEDEITVENIKETFDYQYSWMNRMLANTSISQDEIDTVNKMLAIWKDIKIYFVSLNDLNNQDLDLVPLLDSIETKAKDLDYKYENILKQSVKNEYKKYSNNPNKDNQDVLLALTTIIPDINTIEANAYDAASVNNSLANFVSKTIQTAYRRTKEDYNNYLTELNDLYNNLSDSDKKDNSWMFVDYKTKTGQEERDFVSTISENYYTERRKIFDKLNEVSNKIKISSNSDKIKEYKKLRNEIQKELNNWRKENEIIIDFRSLDNKEYIDSLTNQLGTDAVNDLINKAKLKYEEYLTDKEAYEIDQENLYDENISEIGITEEKKEFFLKQKEENIKTWDLEHNPVIRLQHLEGIKTEADVEGVSNKGYTYLITAPTAKNVSERYKAIQSNPARKAYFDYVKNLTKEMSDNIPEYYKKDFISENFVPVVRKSTLERFSKFSFSGFFTKEYEDFIADITTNQRDSSYVVRDADGVPIKQIPINYLNNNLALEDRSTDINQIVQLFTLMSLNYKTASDLEGFVNNSIEIAKRAKVSPEVSKAPENIVNLLQYTRDSVLYNKKQNDEVLDFRSQEKKNKAKEVEKQIEQLNENIIKEKNPKVLKELVKQRRDLTNELNNLHSGKLLANKVIDKAIDIQSKKAFVLNPFSPAANIFFGLISNSVLASGNKYLTDKHMAKAFRIMLNSTQKFFSFNKSNNNTASKILGMMDYFQIETRTQELYGVDNGPTKGFWSRMLDKGFFMMRGTDYFMRGQLMVAYTLNNSVTINDTKIPLWEIFDNQGNINSQYQELYKTEEFRSQLDNHRNTLLALQKETHGNFDPMSTPMIKKHSIGRLLAQFRLSWVSTGWQSRFQEERFDENLGETKGRYRSIGAKGGVLNGFIRTIAVDQFKYLFNKQIFNDLNEIDKLNMQRNMRELYILEILWMVGLALKHGLDDEDKKNSSYRVAMNLLNRSQDDIKFYLSPDAFNSIVKNPFPAFSVVTDATKAFDSSFKYLTDEDYTTKNFVLSLSRPLPVTSAVNKMVNWSEKEF